MAKVGLPAFTIMVALAVSVKGRLAGLAGIVALFSILISVMTGERINFLIRACGDAGRAGLCPNGIGIWDIVVEIFAILLVFAAIPKQLPDILMILLLAL